MKENNKRNYKIIISILITILLLGGTYAAWNYLTEKTNLIVTMDGDQVNFNAGVDLTVENMLPVYTMEEGITKDIEVYKKNDRYKSGINLYMNLKTFPSALASNSFRWALYKNDKYMTSGSFVNKKQGDTIKLTTVTQKLNAIDKKDNYKLYLWVDAYQESNINMMNKSFTLSIYGQVSFYDQDEEDIFTEDKLPNAPELAEGMIPIKYNYLIDEWQKADTSNTDNDWYNYNEQYWANAVMVTSDSRDRYMNAEVGTTISEDDILAYYVWIPRYRYLLFNTTSVTISLREVQIEFQKKTDEINNGTQNGEWLTHPAFWWDNNSNGEREEGEELSGIWVGKFETGGTSSNPLVKPNIKSLSDLNAYQWFNTFKNMESNTYLTENGIANSDIHMMKNTDWGAITYLSFSKYGKNGYICLNNSSSVITGRSGGNLAGSLKTVNNQYSGITNVSSSVIEGGYYTYNDYVVDYYNNITSNKEAGYGTCASSTSNISGMYDMAGGYYERTMSAVTTSNNGVTYPDGFNVSRMPELKYYDLYNNNLERILGDATMEFKGLATTDMSSASLTGPYRGGYNGYSSQLVWNNQVFQASIGLNQRASTSTSRSVLVLP